MSLKNNRIKNIYLIILTIVTIVCIFIGLFINYSINFKSGLKKSSSTNIDVNESVDAFDSIDLDLNVGDVHIVYGADYNVSIEDYPEKITPTWSVEDKQLIIKQKHNNVHWKDFKNVKCKLTITIPEGCELQTLACDMDMGNLVIDDINATSVALSADMGNIEMNEVNFTTLAVKANMGSVSCDDSNITTAAFVADMGSIDIEGNFVSVSAECDMGSIEIKSDNINNTKFDLKCDMGSIKINGKSHGSSYSN